MLPIFQIGPLVIPVPTFSLLLAFWFGLSLAEKYAPQRGISKEAFYNLAFTGLAAGLIGARAGYILQYPISFIQAPLSLISLNPGMLDSFSGLAGALLGILIYLQRAKLSLWTTLDALTPALAVLALGLATAHIASGESFGSATNLPWAINLWGAKRHPTQFYELLAAAAILGLIFARINFTRPPGTLFLFFVALTAAARLFLEAFHGDSLTILGGIRSAQVIAWIVLAIVLPTLEIIKRKV